MAVVVLLVVGVGLLLVASYVVTDREVSLLLTVLAFLMVIVFFLAQWLRARRRT